MVARVVPICGRAGHTRPAQPGTLLPAPGRPLDQEPGRPSAETSPPAIAAPLLRRRLPSRPPMPRRSWACKWPIMQAHHHAGGLDPWLPPQVALAGLMLRSLQMATRLRHAFDPSAGYAAGATLVQHGHSVTTVRPRHAVARARSKAARPSQHFPCKPALHPCRAGCHRPRSGGRGGAWEGRLLLHVRRLRGSHACWRGQSCTADRARPNAASYHPFDPG